MEMKKKNTNNNNTSGNEEESKKKERHIVSWTQEEDDILREQIGIHGTENWSVIASKFKDKSTRQCRRRWFTYLNSDFKKGGWSPEEDMLLCEAQKIFGNRWTEIAKVVSGRTDNAVKNRFTTLCKKRAKYEALAKENVASCINSNNKRLLHQSETIGTAEVSKRMRRSHIPSGAVSCNFGDISHKPCGSAIDQQLRPTFAVLAQNFCNVKNLPAQDLISTSEEVDKAVKANKKQGTFLKKDDPKIIALMQQAELLSSLAENFNAKNSDQSLEDTWKVLHNILDRNKEGDILQYETSDTDFQVENFKDLVEEYRSRNERSQPSWRQPNLYESPSGSEYSTGSNTLPPTSGDKIENPEFEMGEIPKAKLSKLQTTQMEEENIVEHDNFICVRNQDASPTFNQQRKSDGIAPASPDAEFSSPAQVTTPLFKTLAAEIPTPQFSESERRFLMKTLGMESPSANPTTSILSSPPCKRVLLDSL